MMFLWDWVTGILGYLGLYKKSGKLVIVGLENAGKTTLLHMLKGYGMSQFNPTLHPTSEELCIGNINFMTFDMGGHIRARKVWTDYFPYVDAIVFVIDAADWSRFEEAKIELDLIITNEMFSAVPILVLGNKADRLDAASEQELRSFFHILCSTTGKKPRSKSDLGGRRPFELFMVSVLKKTGYDDAFRWLSQFID